MWPGATSPTWLPLYLIYFPGQGPQELPQDQQNIKEQDPEVVHSLDFVNDRLWLCDLEKIVLPLRASSVNYRCSWNYFLKMVLGVNFLKIAVKLIWASRLVAEKELKDYLDCGIIYFEGYFYFVGAKKWLSNFEFSSNIVCRKCFLLGVQRSRDWLPFYQLYCIFFTTCRSWNLWNFLSATQVKVSTYSMCKLLILYRWRILSDFTSRIRMHRYNFYLQRNKVSLQRNTDYSWI